MNDLLQAPAVRPLPRRNLDRLTKTVLPVVRKLIEWDYFSLSVEGLEHIPRSGPVVFAANHAGWFTLDTFFGALVMEDHIGLDRLPWPAGAEFMFKLPMFGQFFSEAGVFPASWLKTPQSLPPEMQVFCVYPEGVEGNCKSFLHAYQMRAWRTGFLRLALARGATIVPLAIIGGEECLPNIATVRFLKPLVGTILPLPLSLVPLPSRWKFVFHEPVDIRQSLSDIDVTEEDDIASQRQRLREVAAGIRDRVQQTIDRETSDHPLVRVSKRIKRSLG